jgi:molecular chaperone GrpE
MAETDELNIQLKEWKQKAEDERDRVLRVLAEFENYKKRMNRQMEEYRKYANEALLKELLSVVDNLERAIMSSENTNDNPIESCVVEGVEMTLAEILKVLEKFHVASFEALGKPFDPVFHEAVMQQESKDYPENSIIGVLQKGYMIHDRLLRPAMVVVSKGQSSGKQQTR